MPTTAARTFSAAACAPLQLISQVELGSGRIHVAALASGFLTPPPKELVRASRKQVRPLAAWLYRQHNAPC